MTSKQHHSELIDFCSLLMANCGQIIKLNVGGTHFETTKQTLNASEFFSTMLAATTLSNIPIFIDRDPDAFTHILRYLRNPKYKVPAIYTDELDYYLVSYKPRNLAYNIKINDQVYIPTIYSLEFYPAILDFLNQVKFYQCKTDVVVKYMPSEHTVYDSNLDGEQVLCIGQPKELIFNPHPKDTYMLKIVAPFLLINDNWGLLLETYEELCAKCPKCIT
jgi:hypothetical protein